MFSKLFGKSNQLPHCDELFMKYFDSWYDDDSRQRKGFPATRPDMMRVPELIGLSSAQAGSLPEDFSSQVSEQVDRMLDSARSDFSSFLPVSGEPDISWVDAIDLHYDRKRIKELLKTADPSDFSNDYVVTCCEFGAVLAHVMRTSTPRLEWIYEHPYWESALFDPVTGYIIPPFHFAIKKMSEYGVDDGFAAKLNHLATVLEDEKG